MASAASEKFTVYQAPGSSSYILKSIIATSGNRFDDPLATPPTDTTEHYTFLALPLHTRDAKPVAMITVFVEKNDDKDKDKQTRLSRALGKKPEGTKLARVIRAAVMSEHDDEGIEKLLFETVERWAKEVGLVAVLMRLSEVMVEQGGILLEFGYKMGSWERDDAHGKIFTMEKVF
jgi:GNAT superfamily N-acetyltransferase